MGCLHRRGNGFLDALKEMPHLTKLGLPVAKDEDFEAITVSMPLLTGLRSLNLSGSRFLVASPENEEGLFASLTQLTHSSVFVVSFNDQLPTFSNGNSVSWSPLVQNSPRGFGRDSDVHDKSDVAVDRHRQRLSVPH